MSKWIYERTRFCLGSMDGHACACMHASPVSVLLLYYVVVFREREKEKKQVEEKQVGGSFSSSPEIDLKMNVASPSVYFFVSSRSSISAFLSQQNERVSSIVQFPTLFSF